MKSVVSDISARSQRVMSKLIDQGLYDAVYWTIRDKLEHRTWLRELRSIDRVQQLIDIEVWRKIFRTR